MENHYSYFQTLKKGSDSAKREACDILVPFSESSKVNFNIFT